MRGVFQRRSTDRTPLGDRFGRETVKMSCVSARRGRRALGRPKSKEEKKMAKIMTSLVLGVALISTAACTKKPPQDIPPPGDSTGPGPGGDMGGVVPGSAEDFRRSVMSDTVHFALDQ